MGSGLGANNFKHDQCYRDNLHAKTRDGRQWCRDEGPASRSGRVYISAAAAPKSGSAGLVETRFVDAEAESRRMKAAERYRPERIRLLLVAEAPPADSSRYFYFHDVRAQDSLFRHVAEALLGVKPTRENKPEALAQLQERGVFLVDLKPDPVDGTPLSRYVPDLVHRVRDLAPDRIVLIKATVYDTAYGALATAGLPVSSVRIPFPGSGQQKNFLEAFARAIRE